MHALQSTYREISHQEANAASAAAGLRIFASTVGDWRNKPVFYWLSARSLKFGPTYSRRTPIHKREILRLYTEGYNAIKQLQNAGLPQPQYGHPAAATQVEAPTAAIPEQLPTIHPGNASTQPPGTQGA